MGLKESGLRGSLRNVSVSIDAIPDSVVTQYEFEDDSDTSTAIDSVGDNNATLSEPTYNDTIVKVGSNALEFDGSDDELNSTSAVDLVASGDTETVSFAAWVYPRDNDVRVPIGYWADTGNRFYVFNDGSGNWRFGHRVGGSGDDANGTQITTEEWVHVYIELTQNDARMKLDNTEVATYNHSTDISNLGMMTLRSGYGPFGNYGNQVVDDYHAMDGALSDSELQSIIDRAN